MPFLNFLAETPPNVYSVWIAVVQTLGVPVAGVIVYWLNKKLNNIHTLVNGNLDAEKRKNAALRQKMIDNGIDPD